MLSGYLSPYQRNLCYTAATLPGNFCTQGMHVKSHATLSSSFNTNRFLHGRVEQFCPTLRMGDIGVSTPLLKADERTMYTFDDIIRQRAIDEDQSPLIAYPKTKLGVTDYELFTGEHLNRLVDGAAKALIKTGIPPVVSTISNYIESSSN
jgi:hypothetical protein